MKKFILAGLAGLVLAVTLAYVISILPSNTTEDGTIAAVTVSKNERSIVSGIEDKVDVSRDAVIRENSNVGISTGEQQHAKREEPKDELEAHAHDHDDTPMPLHMEAHVPVDLNEFLEAREARRQRFAENYDNILAAGEADLKRKEVLTSQAEQALAQVESLADVELDAVNCNERICRMTLTAGDEESHLELRRMAAGIGVLLGSDAWTYSDPEQKVSHVYLSSPGKKLPNMEQQAAL